MRSANSVTYSPRGQGRFRENGLRGTVLTAKQVRTSRRRRGFVVSLLPTRPAHEKLLPTIVVNLPANVQCPHCEKKTGIAQAWQTGVRKCPNWKNSGGWCNSEFVIKHVERVVTVPATPALR